MPPSVTNVIMSIKLRVPTNLFLSGIQAEGKYEH